MTVGRRVVTALGAVACATALVVAAAPSPAGATTTSAELITVPGTTTPLRSGGSATTYGVALPAGAACPGDTAHDGYLVYSYLVPAGASPTEVSFRTGLPSRWFGYIADGSYFGAVNTAESTGQIVGLPTSFTWTRLTPHDLFVDGARTATWNGGIACANSHGMVTDIWNSTIVFTADPSDPGGFTWRVTGSTHLASPSHTSVYVGIGLLVLASGAAAFALASRRRRHGPPPTADDRAASTVDEVHDVQTVGR